MLPTSSSYYHKLSQSHSTQYYLRFFAKRYLFLAVFVIACGSFLGRLLVYRSGVFRWGGLQAASENTVSRRPPLYSEYHYESLRLPQHDWKAKKPHPTEKFFYVAGHSRGAGWGNAMGELLLNAYIAYKAGRSFVFSNYTWNDNGSPYGEWNGHVIPSLIPYNVMIRGPIVGDAFPAGDNASLAVSREYFEKLCPDKMIIIREAVHDDLSSPNNAKLIVDGWATKLSNISNPCVQSAINSGQLFNYAVFGDREAMLDIWPEFSTSPIMTQFGWSPLIEQAFDTNREFFLPNLTYEPKLSAVPFTSNAERYTQIPGLLAIHIRLGDFEQHCLHMAGYSSRYAAFNSFPELPDHFDPPAQDDGHTIFLRHCLPSLAQIVERVRTIRETSAGEGLRRLHIMTNGNPHYLKALKAALYYEGGWEHISSSRDLTLSWEQKFVSQAVDMLVGQRAQVFIGNGFSTMTASIVMMRMANQLPLESTRFW